MAKNFAAIYARTGDSIALNQKFFAVEETVKGTLKGPVDTDFFYTQEGGGVNHTQAKNSSSHKSGRHNTDVTLDKKTTEFTLPMFVNIDTQAAVGVAEVDLAVRLLWKSMLGKEDISGVGVVFDSSVDPDITFSLFENGDKWAHQLRAAFIESVAMNFPGDGQSGFEFAGMAADRTRVGVAKSISDNNQTGGTNLITLANVKEAKRMPVGSLVMIIEADGSTRSADTLNGIYRKVVSRDLVLGTIVIDGADLADADGSGTPIYICYAEPEAPSAIANIQTGLVGSVDIDGLGGVVDCVRNATVNLANGHELVNYCYGSDSLATPFFVAGGRLNVEGEFEINLNDNVIEFLDDLETFESQVINLVLGNSAGRHLRVDIPKMIFDVPSVTVPAEGSIPVTISGQGLQTALDAADEVKVSYL